MVNESEQILVPETLTMTNWRAEGLLFSWRRKEQYSNGKDKRGRVLELFCAIQCLHSKY
jgi:hypothetical protein